MSRLFIQVGEKIRFFRKAAKLTQSQLGEMVDIDQSYIAKIERGEVNISLETIDKISSALGIHPGEFFTTDENPLLNDKKDIIRKINTLLVDKGINDLKTLYRVISDILQIQGNSNK